MPRIAWPWVCAGVLLLQGAWLPCHAQENPPPLPKGPGLAAKYPGDRGLAKDPAVVFVENFEHADFEALQTRWESISKPEQMSLVQAGPSASAGTKALLVRHVGGESEGGHLYRRLPPGLEKLYFRFYVKFDKDCAPIHHFFHFGGYNPATPYPQGGAGVRPIGQQRFTVGIEPFGDAWRWDYYAYWKDMGGSPPRGQTWGNSFLGDNKPKAPRGTWTCMEAMLKLNTVGKSDGELALWMDGKPLSHLGPGFPKGKWNFDKFLPGEGGEAQRWNDTRQQRESYRVPAGGEPFPGFEWRTNPKQSINFLWVLIFITKATPGHVSQIWFDDIVVAKEYIGPQVRK